MATQAAIPPSSRGESTTSSEESTTLRGESATSSDESSTLRGESATSSEESTTPGGESSKAKFCWGQGSVGALKVESADGLSGTSVVVSFADVMSEQLASQMDGELTQLLDSEISDPAWDPGLAQAIRESLQSTQTDHSSEQSSSAEGATATGGARLDTNPTDGVHSPTGDVHSPTGGVHSPTDGVPDTSSDEILALLLQEGFDAEFQARKSAVEQQLSKKRYSVSGSPPKEGKEKRFLDHSFNSFKSPPKEGKEKRFLDHSFKSLKKGSVDNGWIDQYSDNSTSPESFEDGNEFVLPKHEYTDECESEEDRDWDRFEGEERTKQSLNKRGFALGKDGKVSLTKHDYTLCARRNACKVMEFNTQIQTGDGAGFDMKLSNNVYNALRKHVVAEEKRSARLHEKKERSTAESVMDENSRLMMLKLINGGILDEVNGTISTGKEANVYHGIGGNPEKQVTLGEVAIKVYKTTLNEFKNRDNYIKDDFRFKDKFSKTNNRKMIWMWAEKEMHNLNRIRRAGIPCPEVVCLKKHILVMSFIGSDGKSAPTLKEAILTTDQLEQAYDETVQIMKRMYSKCDLIHADLSEFNLLWHLNRIWVIDVSQSVMIVHPHALQFLLRDCYNITNFFEKRGLVNGKSVGDLFTEVSGKSLPQGNLDGIELLSQVEEYERNMEYLAHGMTRDGDPFDEMFAHSLQEKENELAKTLDPSDLTSFIPTRSSRPVEIKLSKSPPKYRK